MFKQSLTPANRSTSSNSNELLYLPIKKRYVKIMEPKKIFENWIPDDLYNLQKLAEVSTAIATGQMQGQHSVLDLSSGKPKTIKLDNSIDEITYTHKLFDKFTERIQKNKKVDKLEDQEVEANLKNVIVEQKFKTELETNVKSNSDDSRECNECGKRYSTSSNLARHKQTHRSLADKKARKCPYCNKIYVSMPAYSMHVRTHNQGCECNYCGKCFSRPWLLQGHIRTHTGEKPFKCPICSKAFADKSNLRAHIQTHSNTKPHICQRCGKAFALKSYLYKHEESSCLRLMTTILSNQQQAQLQLPTRYRQHQIHAKTIDDTATAMGQKDKLQLQQNLSFALMPMKNQNFLVSSNFNNYQTIIV